jgi:hypothetical protein
MFPLVTRHPWSGSGWFTGAPVVALNLSIETKAGEPHLPPAGGSVGPPAGRRLVAVCPLEQGISPDPHTNTL